MALRRSLGDVEIRFREPDLDSSVQDRRMSTTSAPFAKKRCQSPTCWSASLFCPPRGFTLFPRAGTNATTRSRSRIVLLTTSPAQDTHWRLNEEDHRSRHVADSRRPVAGGHGVAQQPAAGAAGQAAPKVVAVEKLRDNLFVLTGGGGNTAVFVGASGVVVVDTKNPGWGQPILDKIKALTTKPITTIINTHTHGDHVSGNVEFPATVEVIVHENTAANMQEMRASTQTAPSGQPPNIFKANNGTRPAEEDLQGPDDDRDSGIDRIDLYYFGRGHTNGDAWVVFPGAAHHARRRHLLGQEPPGPRCRQRRKRSRRSPTR